LTQQNQQNGNLAQSAFNKLNKRLFVDSSKQTKIAQNKDL
jgi:dipeptidase